MKRGDKVEVTIAGHVVAHAEVKELGDGTATLIVPATAVVMGTRTNLTDLPREEPTTQHIITGVDRATGSSAPVEGVTPPAEVSNPATSEGGTTVESNGGSTTTSVGETTVVDSGVQSAEVQQPGTSASAPASPVEQSPAEA